MLFSGRVVLANCDPAQFPTGSPHSTGRYFRRQFESALFSGQGVCLSAGMLFDIRHAPRALKESEPLIERCAELLATDKPGQPLITVRGLGSGPKVDFADFLAKRLSDPDFIFNAFGGDLKRSEVHYAAEEMKLNVRKEYIDPGYYSIFMYPGEISVSGNFGIFDQKLLTGIGRLKGLHGRLRAELLDFLKSDCPSLYEAMPELTNLLRRFAIILSATTAPHHLKNLLAKTLRERIVGSKALATLAWSGFRFYYRFYAGVEQYRSVWDSADEDMATARQQRAEASNLEIAETADNVFSILESTKALFEIADEALWNGTPPRN